MLEGVAISRTANAGSKIMVKMISSGRWLKMIAIVLHTIITRTNALRHGSIGKRSLEVMPSWSLLNSAVSAPSLSAKAIRLSLQSVSLFACDASLEYSEYAMTT